jgi:hypothetical protein
MPQVTEFPTFGGDRLMPADLAKLCRDVPAGGEPFREFRTRLRNARFWDRDRPIVPLRFLGAGGATVVPSPFMQKLAATTSDDDVLAALIDRMLELNPILFKTIHELLAQRAHGKDEIYKHLGSFAYRGVVPSRPGLEGWLQLGIATGLIRAVGIAVAPGARAEAYARGVGELVIEELLAEDQPLVDPIIPDESEVAGAASAAAAPGAPGAIAPEATAAVVAQIGTPLPPALRHLGAASSLPNPRGRARNVAPSRFAAGFSDELLAETAERIAAWWGEVKPETVAFTPADFGLDVEAWMEGADEVLYKIAVAAALAFRLDTDRAGVLAAFRALEQAGVLGDLYHGTVPDSLPAQVDAKALMLASLAARRCAESPDLASALEQKKSGAEVFAQLDAALGRGLFRIELFWILDQLAQLGVIRHDDLAPLTALPHRLVRDQLFRMGFVETPYAADAAALTVAARAAHRAAGGAPRGDLVVASFALAAGCQYDCPNRRTCEYACRERLD